MTKVDIYSGFLGAGKTTLIKKMIKEGYTGERLVLIENEFGQIGIDGGFLREAGIEINELNSGCICCSLVGDFGKALEKVLDELHPDRILIEPSGVGKLSDVVRAVENAAHGELSVTAKVAVVDASKCKIYMKNFGEFFIDQVENADTIVLSHTKKISEEKLAEAIALLQEHNPTATVVTTDWELLSGKKMLEAIAKDNSLAATLEEMKREVHREYHGEHHHEHHHSEECDDPHCECHHEHHHRHGEECDDPHCECHHDHDHSHHHHHGDKECSDPHCECHHHHHHHHADAVFQSFGAETARKYTAEEIYAILSALDGEQYGTVLRAKGIVEGEDGRWIYFDYVPGEPDVRFGEAEVTGRLCVIGANLKNEALKELFYL